MRILWVAGLLSVAVISISYLFVTLKKEWYDSIEINAADYETLNDVKESDESGTATIMINTMLKQNGKISIKQYNKILKTYHNTNALYKYKSTRKGNNDECI
jgi:hypothetical protein